MIIQTVGSYKPDPLKYESSKLPSKTIPDQSMSVREIVSRFAKGLPISGNPAPPIYDGEDPILPPNFASLDIVEQRQIIQDLKTRVNETQAQLAIKQRDAAIAKRKQDFDKAVEQAVKAKQAEPAN